MLKKWQWWGRLHSECEFLASSSATTDVHPASPSTENTEGDGDLNLNFQQKMGYADAKDVSPAVPPLHHDDDDDVDDDNDRPRPFSWFRRRNSGSGTNQRQRQEQEIEEMSTLNMNSQGQGHAPENERYHLKIGNDIIMSLEREMAASSSHNPNQQQLDEDIIKVSNPQGGHAHHHCAVVEEINSQETCNGNALIGGTKSCDDDDDASNDDNEFESLLQDNEAYLDDDIVILWNQRRQRENGHPLLLPFQPLLENLTLDNMEMKQDLTLARALELELGISLRTENENGMIPMEIMRAKEKEREDLYYEQFMENNIYDLEYNMEEPEFGYDNLGWYERLTTCDDGEEDLEARRRRKMNVNVISISAEPNKERGSNYRCVGYHNIVDSSNGNGDEADILLCEI